MSAAETSGLQMLGADRIGLTPTFPKKFSQPQDDSMKTRLTFPIRIEPVDGMRFDGEWMVGWQVRWDNKRTYCALEDLDLLDIILPGSAFDVTYLPCPDSDPLLWRRMATSSVELP